MVPPTEPASPCVGSQASHVAAPERVPGRGGGTVVLPVAGLSHPTRTAQSWCCGVQGSGLVWRRREGLRSVRPCSCVRASWPPLGLPHSAGRQSAPASKAVCLRPFVNNCPHQGTNPDLRWPLSAPCLQPHGPVSADSQPWGPSSGTPEYPGEDCPLPGQTGLPKAAWNHWAGGQSTGAPSLPRAPKTDGTGKLPPEAPLGFGVWG